MTIVIDGQFFTDYFKGLQIHDEHQLNIKHMASRLTLSSIDDHKLAYLISMDSHEFLKKKYKKAQPLVGAEL